jgi:hypothetical protein
MGKQVPTWPMDAFSVRVTTHSRPAEQPGVLEMVQRSPAPAWLACLVLRVLDRKWELGARDGNVPAPPRA